MFHICRALRRKKVDELYAMGKGSMGDLVVSIESAEFREANDSLRTAMTHL